MEDVVQPLPGFGRDLELEARRPRRVADHLCDLDRRRRQEVELPRAFGKRNQLRQLG